MAKEKLLRNLKSEIVGIQYYDEQVKEGEKIFLEREPEDFCNLPLCKRKLMNRIQQALTKIFDRNRIVFWYDSKKELRKEYEELSLSGIEKVELNNNEFMVKHRILREQPEQNFLLSFQRPLRY